MGNYKGISQKGLAFHAEENKIITKKKRNQENPIKLSLFSLMLVSFYRLFCSKDLGKILQFRFCKQFPSLHLSIILVFCRRFASKSVSEIL